MGVMAAFRKSRRHQEFREWQRSQDAYFDKVKKDNKNKQEAVIPPKPNDRWVKEDEAFGIDFENYMGYLPDERLDDLAEVYEHFNYAEVHNLTFTAFVKAVISGRWREYAGTDDEPPSTILRKYKLPTWYEEPRRRRMPSRSVFIRWTVWIFILLIIVTIFEFKQ